MIPKLRNRGYVPFFVIERKRSEAALIQVVQEAFVQGVSTRKMEKLARSLGIENLTRSQVSEMTKGLNEQVQEFRIRSLADTRYPVIWTDALYEKVRVDGRVASMAILIVCDVNEQGHREVLAVEPMLEESKESYSQLFGSLQQRGLKPPSLVISDANKGLMPHSGKLSRCLLAAVQGSLHTEYSGSCTAERERSLCGSTERNLAGSFCWIGHAEGRPTVGAIWKEVSQGNGNSGRRVGRFAGLLCFSGVGCPQNLIHQYVGTAEQGNPPQDQRRRHVSQLGFLLAIGHRLPHGICRRLVCFPSVFKSNIRPGIATKCCLIHFPEP